MMAKKKAERNDPCPCGSGKKYKNCCQGKEGTSFKSTLGIFGIAVAVILGLLIVGMALSGSDGRQDCPPGLVWSDAHNHCH